jgi:hypothetical protein
MRRLLASTFVMALMAANVVACRDATAPTDITGTYHLRTVNGFALPVVMVEVAGAQQELLAWQLTLLSDNTWTSSITMRFNYIALGTSRTDVEASSGTWTRLGRSIEFTTPRDRTTATIENGALVTVAGGRTFVFRR